jgi:ketosteroid isomerase-like protein
MSQENVEIVKNAVEEYIATGQIAEAVAADVIYDASAMGGWAGKPVYHGIDGYFEMHEAWTEPYDDWSVAMDEVLDAGGDRVVTVLRQRGRMRGSDAEVEMRFGMVYTVESRKIRRMQMYVTPEEALEAAGLSE